MARIDLERMEKVHRHYQKIRTAAWRRSSSHRGNHLQRVQGWKPASKRLGRSQQSLWTAGRTERCRFSYVFTFRRWSGFCRLIVLKLEVETNHLENGTVWITWSTAPPALWKRSKRSGANFLNANQHLKGFAHTNHHILTVCYFLMCNRVCRSDSCLQLWWGKSRYWWKCWCQHNWGELLQWCHCQS